jgi:hypothetical protein
MLKSLISIILLAIAFESVGQEHNFQVEDLNLTWVKVFEQPDSVFSLSKLAVALTDQRIEGDIIYGSFKSLADWKAAGYTEMTTPIYVARKMILAEVMIELRPGRYRVTVKNIRLEQLYDDSLTEAHEIEFLQSYAVNRSGEFKPAFLKQPAEIYQGTFERLFSFRTVSDEW